MTMPLKIVQYKFFCEVLLSLRKEPKSFREILKEVKTNSDTLSRRLKEMKSYNLIEQVIVETEKGQSRIKYKLSDKGRALITKIEEFIRLASEIEKQIKR